MKENAYLEFYGENNISPVHQDISDYKVHLRRRQKLYRQCGIPTVAFSGKTMLEVGPGGGYNALAALEWGISHIDLVEPNPKGAEEIPKLFQQYEVDASRFHVYNTSIEKFDKESLYDYVIAEGFLPLIPNKREVCNLLIDKTKPGGVIVVTCQDLVSTFVESIKRLVGHALTQDYSTLDDKVNALVPIFEPQIKMLRGASRPIKDWIEDQIFNPAICESNGASMSDMFDFFEGLDLLGSSPRCFQDWSWYKDIWYGETDEYKKQFEKSWLSLLLTGMPEQRIDEDIVSQVADYISQIKRYQDEYESTGKASTIKNIYDLLLKLKEKISLLDERFIRVFGELTDCVRLLSEGKTPDMNDYPSFFAAFGRAQQYMSFMKI